MGSISSVGIYRRYSGTLLIKPSKKNVKAFYAKVKGIVMSNLMVKQVELIRLLNPVLRGWAQYHHPVVAKETFSKLDSLLLVAVDALGTSQASEEEPEVGGREVLADHRGPDRVRSADSDRKTASRDGCACIGLPIRKSSGIEKVMGGYNPFDPEWEAYGEDLRAKRLLRSMAYRACQEFCVRGIA